MRNQQLPLGTNDLDIQKIRSKDPRDPRILKDIQNLQANVDFAS